MSADVRKGYAARKTKETDVFAEICLDRCGEHEIATGIGFFDHMLTAMAVHGFFGLKLEAKGDLHVDGHHTVEDCGIVIGQALKNALGDKVGIARFGSMLLPMDEALAQVALDLSGRSYLALKADFESSKVGDFETSLTREFFQGLVNAAGITLHINLLAGSNDHHSCEAIFKAFGHALKAAVKVSDDKPGAVLSSKGVLA